MSKPIKARALWRYQTQLSVAFALFTVVLCVLFSLYALIFAFTVEDKFLETELRREATRLESNYLHSQSWLQPSLPEMHVHASSAEFPSEIRTQYKEHPQRREFYGAQGRHFHLYPLFRQQDQANHSGAWLLWQAESALVFRPMRKSVFWILGLSAAGALTLALLLAHWFGKRYARGFSELALWLSQWRADHGRAFDRNAKHGQSHGSYELAEIEQSMQQMLWRIKQLLDAEREFTASVSHELRTPIAVIRSISDRMLSADQATRDVQLIAQAAQRSEAILSTLLTLARSAELNPQRVALLPALERAVVELSVARPAATFDICETISAHASVMIHPAALMILLHTVLDNAARHGEGTINVRSESGALVIENKIRYAKLANTSEGDPQHAESLPNGFGLLIAQRITTRFELELQSHKATDSVWVARIAPVA
jgi:signal transduction histidine kinase